jgi:hypothetical protein
VGATVATAVSLVFSEIKGLCGILNSFSYSPDVSQIHLLYYKLWASVAGCEEDFGYASVKKRLQIANQGYNVLTDFFMAGYENVWQDRKDGPPEHTRFHGHLATLLPCEPLAQPHEI